MANGTMLRARGPQAAPLARLAERVSQLELGQLPALLFGEL